jgi:hypothetical protein
MRRVSLLSSTALTAVSLVAATVAHGADAPAQSPAALPAVDGINYKAALLGGGVNRYGLGAVSGSITAPLGTQYGVQLDGTAASLGGRFLGSGAGHLFWRNPAVGLVGLYGSYTRWSHFSGVWKAQGAVELESYAGRWTVQALLGVERGDAGSGAVTFDSRTRFFDQINLNYYVTDNARLRIGHRYLGGKHALALGAEWAVPMGNRNMGSFFIEGRIGEQDYRAVWAGVRIYVGQKDKPLIRRHREDDPDPWEIDAANAFLNALGEGGCAGIIIDGTCISGPL